VRGKIDNIVYVEVMLAAIYRLAKFTEGIEEQQFIADEVLKNACLMQLLVIGEYSGKLDVKVREYFPDIEWTEMKKARNFYIHVYDYIEWDRVWVTIQTVLPELKNKIEKLLIFLQEEENNNGTINQ